MENILLTPEIEKDYLDKDEDIIWRSERVGIDAGRVFIQGVLVVLLIPLFGLFFSIGIYYLYLLILDSPVFLQIFLLVLSIYIFYRFIIWLTQYLIVFGLYISNKRLVFLEIGEKFNIYIWRGMKLYFTDFEDIEYLESLNIKNGNYTKYRIKSVFYKNIFGYKFFKAFKSYRTIYLDDVGLELLKKIKKEKSLNINFK